MEQSVVIQFKYGMDSMDALYKLEDQLEKRLQQVMLGVLDGHEMAIDYSDGILLFYSDHAKPMVEAIKELLDQTPFLKGASVIVDTGKDVGPELYYTL